MKNQKSVLNKEGIIFHVFAKGEISQEKIKNLVSKEYEILENGLIDKDFYIIAKLM